MTDAYQSGRKAAALVRKAYGASICLALRQVVASARLTPLHDAGVAALFDLRLDSIAAAAVEEPMPADFVQQLAVHAARAALDEPRAAALLPLLQHVWTS